MRIHEALIQAIRNNTKLTKQNTFFDGKSVYLHGNKLSEYTGATLYLCDGTYPSRTTQMRLKAIAEAYRVPVEVRFLKGTIYFEYMGKRIASKLTVVL